MKSSLWSATALTVSAVALTAFTMPGTALSRQHGKPPRRPPAKEVQAHPREENQFVTVEEFVKARRAPHTAVSVEGYAVEGYRKGDGGLYLVVVDAVDHVLNAADADSFARGGASGIVPAATLAKHPSWAWTTKGAQRFVMFTGAGHAQKELHDTIAKIRLTGFTVAGRPTISPITKVEYQDDNGDWRSL